MTGMKEGAGENPFATTSDSNANNNDSDAEPDTETMSEPTQPTQIPMILRRESVQDGRDRVPLFLQRDTKRAERDALHELEERFDRDVSLTDLREALILAGLSDLDAVERTLHEWGYGVSFD